MNINCREVDLVKCRKCIHHMYDEDDDICQENGICCIDVELKECTFQTMKRDENLNSYLLKMNPINKVELEKHGKIIFDAKIIKDLFVLETNLKIEEVRKIPGVYQVEEDSISYIAYVDIK